MPDILAPHFDLPFRISDHVIEVEQSTLQDIGNCVYTVIVTPLGWRDEAPQFGVPDLVFTYPVMTEDVQALVRGQEQRADLVFREYDDGHDMFKRMVDIAVRRRGGVRA